MGNGAKGNKSIIRVEACRGCAAHIPWAEECADFSTPEVKQAKKAIPLRKRITLCLCVCITGAWQDAITYLNN